MPLSGHMVHLVSHFSAVAAGSLVGAIWEGTVLAASVALCLHFVKGIAAGVRSLLWTAVLLLVVALHIVPLAGAGAAAAGSGGIVHAGLRWSLAIVGVWAMLSLFRAAQLVHSAVGLRRIARRATVVRPSAECAALLRTRLHPVELCSSSDVDRPSVIGFFGPRILIPQALYDRLSASELEQIVLHEMEHLRRGDDWTNLLQKVSLMLFPLNPVLLWVEHRLCVERELACDDRVMHVTKAKKAYASCLVNIAEHSVLRRGASLALGAWEKQSELGRRVRRILRQPEGVMGRRQTAAVASMLVLGMVGGAVTLAREPQLVSFAPVRHPVTEASIVPASSMAQTAFHAHSASPKIIDTVFREPLAAETPGLAKAQAHTALRTSRQPAVTKYVVARQRAAAHLARHCAPQEPSWVMLTDWTVSAEPPQVRLVVSAPNQATYAAIQMSNGWLIVQL